MSLDRSFLPAVVLLLAGCSSEKSSDSGLVNALAQIRAVNLPLDEGDPVRQPELGLTAELRHNIADSMAPRAFGDLHDGSYRLHATDYPAVLSNAMSNTDSTPFMDLVAAVSLRENRRLYETGNRANPHWHQTTDLFETFSDADFMLGFNAAQTTLGAVAKLAGIRILR